MVLNINNNNNKVFLLNKFVVSWCELLSNFMISPNIEAQIYILKRVLLLVSKLKKVGRILKLYKIRVDILSRCIRVD